MTRIEKAVKEVSDLYDFYRQIPKISRENLAKEEKHQQAFHGTGQQTKSLSPENPLPHRR